MLHCVPLRYNWAVPFENPQHCYGLKPFVMVVAALGVGIDALTWVLPHYVVWRKLKLRLAHKLAITTIFAFGSLCDISRV